jgi:hypothetical protein
LTTELRGAQWRKSSYSGGSGGNCVEVATNLPGLVAVRDSKHPNGPVLVLPPTTWRAFTTTLRAGRPDSFTR